MDYAIVLLSYNHENLTSQCLKSIINCNFPAQKIFLVHNGSDLKKVNFLSQEFPHIQHLITTKNVGYSGGANYGLREAFKNFSKVLFLTNDTEVIELPSFFPKEKLFFSIPIYLRNSQRLHSLHGELNPKRGKLNHVTDDISIQNTVTDKSNIPYIPGTAFGIHQDVFVATSGFNEKFHTYWEDVDLSYRSLKLGFKLDHDASFVVKHKVGKTCHKDRFYTLYLYQRNRRWFMERHKLTSFKFYVTYYLDLLKLFFRTIKKTISNYENKSDFNYLRKLLYGRY